jgi:hypothetical protein
MEKKKVKFRLESIQEKDARLDVRITAELRERLELFCRENSKKLTDAVTEALNDYLGKERKE